MSDLALLCFLRRVRIEYCNATQGPGPALASEASSVQVIPLLGHESRTVRFSAGLVVEEVMKYELRSGVHSAVPVWRCPSSHACLLYFLRSLVAVLRALDGDELASADGRSRHVEDVVGPEDEEHCLHDMRVRYAGRAAAFVKEALWSCIEFVNANQDQQDCQYALAECLLWLELLVDRVTHWLSPSDSTAARLIRNVQGCLDMTLEMWKTHRQRASRPSMCHMRSVLVFDRSLRFLTALQADHVTSHWGGVSKSVLPVFLECYRSWDITTPALATTTSVSSTESIGLARYAGSCEFLGTGVKSARRAACLLVLRACCQLTTLELRVLSQVQQCVFGMLTVAQEQHDLKPVQPGSKRLRSPNAAASRKSQKIGAEAKDTCTRDLSICAVSSASNGLFDLFGDNDEDMIDALLALCVLHGRIRKQDPIVALGFAQELEPSVLFAGLVKWVVFDHSVLLDFLISSETKFLEYLLRYLRYAQIYQAHQQARVVAVVRNLTEVVAKLNAKGLMPYDAGALLRALRQYLHTHDSS